MEKILILQPFMDRENGHSYYPGPHLLVEDVKADDSDAELPVMDYFAAQRALNDGLAEALEGEAEQGEPENTDEEFVG